MERLQNTHHVFWERRNYTTPLERRLRRHRGFVVPIDLQNHSELHANLDQPEKPNAPQIKNLLNDIGDFQLGRGGLYVIYHTIEQFNIWSHSSNESLADNAQAIADNLEAQTAYINFLEPQSLRQVA